MNGKIYGLLGRKLGHSWSAPIHKAMGCETYRLIELEPEELGLFLAREDIGGLNVTIPYKKDVIPFCDELDPLARAIGSVNTIVRRGERLLGFNTDVLGFRTMAKRIGLDFCDKKVLVLGAGGASATVVGVTRTEGARETVVVSRRGDDNFDNIARHADADIIVNATPVGMYPNCGESLVDLRRFPKCSGVLDLVYNPQHTALLIQAEELGIPCSDGLPMLVWQAAAAEEYFFEKEIPDSLSEKILAGLRRDFTNLVLIGMPGCGKSTVGRCLGRLSGREVLELDAMIAERAGCSIPEIFAAQGEEGFRTLEHKVIEEGGKLSGKIIVTGGGAVTREENYAPLHQNGRIYQIVRPVSQLPREGRPLSQNADLAEMEQKRAPMYRRFRDISINNCGTAKNCAESIWRNFCEHFDP